MGMGLLSAIRDADWLTFQRVRAYALMLGVAAFALLAMAWIEATGETGSDFLAFWGAGRIAAGGDPALAYDLAVQERVQTATASRGWFAFVNPPPFLFLAAPFGLLPFPLAWIAWVAVGYAVFVWAGIRAFPRLWPLVLVYPGALIAATHAQTGLFVGALLIAAVHRLDSHPVRSGAMVGALIVKPHLALLWPFWLAAGRRWRAFAAAAVCVLALILVSWAVFGTATWLGYRESWDASADLMRRDAAEFYLRMVSLYAQARLYLAHPVALGLAVLLTLATIALAVRSWQRFTGDVRASGALLLAASALASPYLFSYDLPFLLFPTLWLVEQGRRHGFRPFEKLALVGLYFAPFALRAAALPLGLNLMPLASAVLVWLVWSRGGREPDMRSEG